MSFTKLRAIAAAAAVMAAGAANAAHLSPSQARERVIASASPKGIAAEMPLAALSYTGTDSGAVSGLAAYYVFSDKSGGYVIASADDELPAVLGYSGTAVFDPEMIPENMKWWLDGYARQISWYIDNKSEVSAGASPVYDFPERKPVEPLVKTTWDQGSPYNQYCPSVGGEKTYTGCVATAMAQVVNYHQWPAQGTGVHSYTWNNQTLSFDYSATMFAWDKMLYSYVTSSPEANRNAVATLMLACGVGVDMDYGVDASGAISFCLVRALVENFGYDKGAAYLMREYFTDEQWDGMMYAELENGRPILYGGQANVGAHQFICDGYDGDGYYHINWGWGGLSDGYFLLSALDPFEQGIGGSDSGFNYGQDAVCGVQRPVEGSSMFLPVYASGGIEYSDWYNLFLIEEGYFCYYPDPMALTVGVKIVDKAGAETFIAADEDKYFPGWDENVTEGFVDIAVSVPSTLAAGVYKVYPVVSRPGSGEWSPIYIPQGEDQYVEMTVASDGTITYGPPSSGAEAIEYDSDSLVDVYNMQGVKVRSSVEEAVATAGLPAGIYIAGGRKVIVR